MTREIDFSDPNYRELTRELALGVLNGPYTEAMEEGTRALNLGEIVFEVLNSEWLATVKREAAEKALTEFADYYNDLHTNLERSLEAASADYWQGADDAARWVTAKMRFQAEAYRQDEQEPVHEHQWTAAYDDTGDSWLECNCGAEKG